MANTTSATMRLRVAFGLLLGLRVQDLRAARTYMETIYAAHSWPVRIAKFLTWTSHQMFVVIPDALREVSWSRPVSRLSYWLEDKNPWADHPWAGDPSARLAKEADTVVIGAGFTGGALAYFWSKRAPGDRVMAVLEMDDPASGASGRNEGAVVMGRFFMAVRDSVRADLRRVRTDLTEAQREKLARQFATAYCRAGYRSGEMIAKTVADEKFDCGYHRNGWVQSKDGAQAGLEESVQLAQETGFTDWTKISPEEVYEKSGMRTKEAAGFSKGCASWHPAKWVWCLFGSALRDRARNAGTPGGANSSNVLLFTRTRVLRVEDAGECYLVHTNRGVIRARHIVNATESYTPMLHPQFRDKLEVRQTQAAVGDGGPASMKPNIVLSATKAFWERHGDKTLFGSDFTRLPWQLAGQNKPSRFISKFFLGHMKELYGPYRLHVTHEWSGTVGRTADEFPMVGVMDGKRQYIIAGMVGSGSNVSFNAGRCIVNRVLGLTDEPDDYPPEFFAPTRVLDPKNHPWPKLD